MHTRTPAGARKKKMENVVVGENTSRAPRSKRTPISMVLRMVGMFALARRIEERQVVSPEANVPTAEENSRSFVLRIVQPGLAGLMDGSVSTLAPIFAAAFATGLSFDAFRIGLAAATGAGISMAFAEALSDDGSITGRGNPWLRGGVTGLMTFVGGSLHTLPFLISDLHTALYAAYLVVAVELIAIALIRHRFFGTNWGLSILQVVGGGVLVFGAAVYFGNV